MDADWIVESLHLALSYSALDHLMDIRRQESRIATGSWDPMYDEEVLTCPHLTTLLSQSLHSLRKVTLHVASDGRDLKVLRRLLPKDSDLPSDFPNLEEVIVHNYERNSAVDTLEDDESVFYDELENELEEHLEELPAHLEELPDITLEKHPLPN
jgi:hypothetical protein